MSGHLEVYDWLVTLCTEKTPVNSMATRTAYVFAVSTQNGNIVGRSALMLFHSCYVVQSNHNKTFV